MKNFYELDFDEIVEIGKKITDIGELIYSDFHLSTDLQISIVSATKNAIKQAYDISEGTVNKCVREWNKYKDTRREIFMARKRQWIKKTTENA